MNARLRRGAMYCVVVCVEEERGRVRSEEEGKSKRK